MKHQVVLPGEDGLIQIEGAATACAPRGPGRHEYLDTVRNSEVWRRTEEGARAVGSFSLATLGALPRGLVREKIRKHTGVEADPLSGAQKEYGARVLRPRRLRDRSLPSACSSG